MTREQEYFDTLRKIAKDFHKSDWFTDKNTLKAYGLNGHEALEASYENMQEFAASAIRGRKRPKESGSTPETGRESGKETR